MQASAGHSLPAWPLLPSLCAAHGAGSVDARSSEGFRQMRARLCEEALTGLLPSSEGPQGRLKAPCVVSELLPPPHSPNAQSTPPIPRAGLGLAENFWGPDVGSDAKGKQGKLAEGVSLLFPRVSTLNPPQILYYSCHLWVPGNCWSGSAVLSLPRAANPLVPLW